MFHSKPLHDHPKDAAFRVPASPAQGERLAPTNAPVELLKSGRHRVALLNMDVGAEMPEQRHLYADKQMTVLEGCAKLHHNGQVVLIHEGGTHFVPFGTKHRICNGGKIGLKILELRSGACVEDDDLAS